MSAWREIGIPLLLAFVGGGIAVLWPSLQLIQRGWKFRRIIKRELQEIGPDPQEPVTDHPKPWWDYLTRRFVHEEIFNRTNISQNRDFLLSLNPTVVYEVSQLWISWEKGDGDKWLDYLRRLSAGKVGSKDLKEALPRWEKIIDAHKTAAEADPAFPRLRPKPSREAETSPT